MVNNTLFYSKIRAGVDGEADDDKQCLVQEQKACRARARQYSLETNRRRKVLEDKRRQQDIKEQRLRENILQQRKQRLQEATERFQRAHLPPSQRRPGQPHSTSTRAPNLDEALSHIQGTQFSYIHPSSFIPGTTTISRNCIPSPKPPEGSSSPRNLHAVSTAQAYAKLMQERSMGDFKTNPLRFINQLQENLPKGLEELRTEEHSDTQISHSESLDSLENEVPQHGHGSKPDSLDLPEVHDTRSPTLLQRQLNFPSPSSNHCPPKSVYPVKVVSQQGLPSSSSSSSPSPVKDESADEVQNVQNVFKKAKQCNVTAWSKTSNIQATIPCQKQVFATNSGHTEHQYGTTIQENISRNKSTVEAHCKKQTVSDTIHLEDSNIAQQSNSDYGELSKCTKHLSEMQAAHKASGCIYSSASDMNKVSPSLENPALQPAEAKKSFQPTKGRPDEDDVLVLERRTQLENSEKYKRAEHPILASEYSDSRLAKAILPKPSKMAEELDKTSADTLSSKAAIDPKSRNVQFMKGILKKKLKCIRNGDAKLNYTPGHFTFSKQMAMTIQDSLELSRSKFRDLEINKCIQKKLRWFDEMNSDRGENKEMVTKELSKQAETENRLTQPPQQPLVDQKQGSFHSWYMNTPSGTTKNNKTSSSPADSNSTKQAWPDVGPQKGKQHEPTGESRMKKAVSCTTELWVPQQVHSAGTGSVTISSQARRGTTMRPQSSNQVQHMLRTQGKILVPRPPPRSELTGGNSGQPVIYITKTGNNDECSQGKTCLAVEQVLYKDNPEGQPVLQRHLLKTDEGTILAPVPPSYACMYETMSKGIITFCQPDGQVDSCSNGFRKGFLDRTPTDDEISLLWHGVRSALVNKNGDSRSLQTNNGPLSVLPQTHANLSHVTISGDGLFSGVKAVARTGGVFLSPSNVRRPTLENNMPKNRTAALGYRKAPVLYQAPVPITASKTVQMFHDQGSEVIDGDKQVAVDSAQFQRPVESLQSRRGLSALSLEEQKLLQSLNRLNHRLQYVQDVAAGNPALKGIVNLDPVYNQSPQPGKRSCATQRRLRQTLQCCIDLLMVSPKPPPHLSILLFLGQHGGWSSRDQRHYRSAWTL
ncbi:centrosomal protein of 126 kDa [Neoarius graeffei]|uniref:centrosomal protein of 126 kDa n=1 Tax=Neoarius graeffei TaxID=443677 RepID=UPI00298C5800|nr:centrosomal protein of 126 kDa [Neoarius graeffei]